MAKAYRYVSLDSYRFFAASGVVVFHYGLYFELDLPPYFPPLRHFNNFVDFFFLLSGFVIATGYADRLERGGGGSYADFLRARFARLYPLHIATLCVSLAVAAAGSLFSIRENHPEVLALSNLPANLAMAQAWGFSNHLSFNGPSWSISAEWFLYLISPALFVLARRLSIFASILLTALIVSAIILFRDAMELRGHWLDASCDFGMLRGVPTFYAGIVIARVVASKAVARVPPWWSVHALFVLAIAVLGAPLPRESVLVVFAAMIFAAALADRGGAPSIVKSSIASSLGNASYGLYMIHFLLALPVLFVSRKLGLAGTSWMLVNACLAFAASLGLALLSFRYFEIPMRKWIARPRGARHYSGLFTPESRPRLAGGAYADRLASVSRGVRYGGGR